MPALPPLVKPEMSQQLRTNLPWTVISRGFIPQTLISNQPIMEVKFYRRPAFYALQISTDMTNWVSKGLGASTPILTNTYPWPAIWYLDTTVAEATNRFYRVQEITSEQFVSAVTNGVGSIYSGVGWVDYDRPVPESPVTEFIIEAENADELVGHKIETEGDVVSLYFRKVDGAHALYNFHVTVEGDYTVWGRVDTTWNDSFTLGMDVLDTRGFGDYNWNCNTGTNTFVWEQSSVLVNGAKFVRKWHLEPGDHFVRLGLGETYTRIDKIAVFLDGTVHIVSATDQ